MASDTSPTVRESRPSGFLVRWVWRDYLRHHKSVIAIAVVMMILEGSMVGAISYIVQPLFDTVFVGGQRDMVVWMALGMAMIFVVRAIASFLRRVLMQGVGLKVVVAMQRDMVAKLMTLDSAFFQSNPPGTLIERVRGDTTAANGIWATALSSGGRDVISLIALLGVAISVDWVWTVIALAGAPLLLGPVLGLQRYVRRKALNAREGAAHLSTRLDEIFHGVNTIKLAGSEEHENKRFKRTVDTYLSQEMKARSGRAGIPMMTDFVAALGFGGVLYYGGNQIIDGDKTLGEFMSFFTAMGLLFEPLRNVANLSGAWQTARASLDRLRDIFESEATIFSPASPVALPEAPGKADIRFENVVVQYGSDPALRGASFTAAAGETTALVGASGAGKSTIFNVLTRLVDPSSGEISIAGIPTNALDLGTLRGLFSVVTQDAPMFDDSLRDNIVLNTEGVSDADLAASLETANLTDFVSGLPDGLEAAVGPRGSALSGGQKQRVAIARAVARNAPILLLDEATSALDAESEKHVQEALDRLSADRTTIVIAHRLSTIRRADKIVVMQDGRVIDEGRHDELLARGGVYARLHELQFSED